MKVAFLISRQGRAVSPSTWWLRAALSAARWAAGRGWTLVAGSGLITHDFVRWAFRAEGGSVIDVGLAGVGGRENKTAALRARDREVADLADALVAVAVRSGGIMESEGLRAISAGKVVHVLPPPRRSSAYGGNSTLLAAGARPLVIPDGQVLPSPPPSQIEGNPVLGFPESGASGTGHPCPHTRQERRRAARPVRPIPANFLWHFTRSCPGPWPGQTQDEYFSALARSDPGAAHTGLDTLIRIDLERTLRASAKIIRGRHPVVSFTAANPREILAGRKFRQTLARWDFEPYAIGIRAEAARRMGVRPVSYLPSGEYRALPEEDRPFYQRADKDSLDWRHEREWRHAGDFNLVNIPRRDLYALIPASEAPDVAGSFTAATVCLIDTVPLRTYSSRP